MVFAKLQNHEKEAFFSLLDEYFTSRPDVFGNLAASSDGAGSSRGASAASAVHHALASNPETTSRLISAGLKHGVPKSSPYSATASDPEVGSVAGRVAAASLAFSARNNNTSASPPQRSAPPIAQKPSGAPGLVSSKKFGDVDMSSKGAMIGSLYSGNKNKNSSPAPPPAPSAFGATKNAFAPPPTRRTSDAPALPHRQSEPEPEPEPEEEEEEGSQGEWALALYDYNSGDAGDLQIKENEHVLVTERTSDDCFGDKIYALLIGIDEYKDSSIKNLAGCVNDCKDVKHWLEESFRSPEIVFLENSKASRDAIMEEINKIAANSVVRKDDPILIYFAGHGAEVEPLEEWKLLSQRKVVILDSCHSASGSRTEQNTNQQAEGTIRAIELSDHYANFTLLNENDFADSDDTGGFSRASSTTPINHILLAACREDKTAREKHLNKEVRGLFTYHLFQKLRQEMPSSRTYDELILSLGALESQYPHCDSLNKNRLLFSMKDKHHEFFSIVSPGNPESSSHLQLGLSHNLQESDCFLIFKDDKFSSEGYVGEGLVEKLKHFKSILHVPPLTPNSAFAVRVIQPQAVCIIVPENLKEQLDRHSWFPKLGVELAAKGNPIRHPYLALGSSKSGVLALTNSDDSRSPESLKFKFLDADHPLAETYPHLWPQDEAQFLRLFHHMSHFYHHLHHGPSGNQSVEVAVWKLNPPEILLDQSDAKLNPCRKGHIHVVADGEAEYGFKVTNKSTKPIFFSLFYFSLSRFRIDALYSPPTVADGAPTPCLVANESKTIGYGNPGDEGFVFELENGQANDVGYLKLFYSGQHHDLLHIKRPSLFHGEEQLEEEYREITRKSGIATLNEIKASISPRSFEAFTIPIFQVSKDQLDNSPSSVEDTVPYPTPLAQDTGCVDSGAGGGDHVAIVAEEQPSATHR
ncbi:hypothetical protein DXG01_009783 [Tephrocybe rancida]|nr:hypothetical protein DXG01_009783 [Tephrocybe rancida]